MSSSSGAEHREGPPPGGREVDAVARDIIAAAKLRHEMMRYEIDLEFQGDEDDESKVFYAIDTNVLYMYLDSGETPQKIEYGTVFEEDRDETAAFLTSVISHYIFSVLGGAGQTPLLLLPGHDGEALRYFDRIVSMAALEPVSGEPVRQRLLEFIQAAREADPADIERLVEYGRLEVRRYLYQAQGPAECFARFKRMLEQDVVRALDGVAGHPKFQSLAESLRGTEADLRAGHSVRQMFKLAQLRKAWSDRLHKTSKQSGIEVDAMALARLELINQALEPLGKRLILITGAPSMLEVTDGYRPDFCPQHRTFADLYIRSPRAFLAAPEVIKPCARQLNSDEPVSDWLNAYLAGFLPSQGADLQDLKRIVSIGPGDKELRASIEDALSSDPRIVESRKSSWAAHVDSLRSAHSTISPIAMNSIDSLVGQPSGRAGLEALLSYVVNHIEESWDSFFEVIARSGFEFIHYATDPDLPYRRTVPPVTFNRNPKMSAFALRAATRTIVQNVEMRGEESTGFADLKHAFEDIRRADDTGYSIAIFMSLLFAYADRGMVAFDLAERAVEIFERQPAAGLSSGVTGREAYYLSAALYRPLVKDPGDFDDVVDRLKQFDRARRRDRKDEPGEPGTGLRFRAELCFVRACKLLFGAFVPASKFAAPTQRDLERAIRRVERVYREARGCGNAMVVSVTRRRLMTYGMVMIALYARECGSIATFDSLAQEWSDMLGAEYERSGGAASTVQNAEDQTQLSFFSRCAFVYSAAYASSPEHRRLAVEERQKLFRSLAKSRNLLITAPYDRGMYEMMLSS